MKTVESAKEFLKITVNRQAFNHMNRMADLLLAGQEIMKRAKLSENLPTELRLEMESWLRTVANSPSN